MKLNSKSLIWGAISLFLFYLFYDLIPLDVYAEWNTLFTIVGSIATTIAFLVFVIHTFYAKDKSKEVDDKNDNSGYVFFAILMLGIFGLGFLFLSHQDDKELIELEQNAHYTLAKVADGSSFSTRKHDFTSIEVVYQDAENKVRTTKISVSKHEFHRFYKFQEIPIKVSKRYPSLVRRISMEQYLLHHPKPLETTSEDTVITDPRERLKRLMESKVKAKN